MMSCGCCGLTFWYPSPAMLSSPNTGLQNSMSSVGVGQPSTPTISTSAPIDPSSMQRAYAALGLPYSSQATGQAPTQQAPGAGQTAGAPNTQAQQQLPQQMRPISALGKFFMLKNDSSYPYFIHWVWFLNQGSAVCSLYSVFTGNQMALGNAAMGVPTSEQTNLHTDSLPNTLNTNKSVSVKYNKNNYIHLLKILVGLFVWGFFFKGFFLNYIFLNWVTTGIDIHGCGISKFSSFAPAVSCCQMGQLWAQWAAYPQQHLSLPQAPGKPGMSTSLRTCAITSYTNCKCIPQLERSYLLVTFWFCLKGWIFKAMVWN